MARIVLWIAPLQGPVNASRKLAKDLVRAGHDVFYTGTPDSAPLVAAAGIPFVPVFQEWFPEGFMAARKKNPGRGWRRLTEFRSRGKFLADFLDALTEDNIPSLEELFHQTRPDLILIPSCVFESILWALAAHRRGVTIAYVTSIFLRPADRGAGPIGDMFVPRPNIVSDLRVQLAWTKFRIFHRCVPIVNRMLSGIDFRRVVFRLATNCGYPATLLSEPDLFTLRVSARELVLYPSCFDLPGGEHPNRTYAEASIDLDRWEEPMTDRLSHAGLPLVYCSLGTLDYHSPARRRMFLQAIIDAASALRPIYQFVIATGDELDPDSFLRVPSHVLLLKRAPQLTLLRRAALMITHGGANSVKECAYFGVPVLVFPMAFDQPATAVRVLHHGLGLVGSMKDANPDRVLQLLQTVLSTSGFRLAAAAMSRRLIQMERTGAARQFVEDLIADSRSAPIVSSHSEKEGVAK